MKTSSFNFESINKMYLICQRISLYCRVLYLGSSD